MPSYEWSVPLGGRGRHVLILMRGLPGCGKTTWALKWLAHDPAHRARVCRDDLRAMLFARDPVTGHAVFIRGVTEPVVVAARNSAIHAALAAGLSVVCDETALEPRKAEELEKIAGMYSAAFEVKDMGYVPLDTCLERNAARPEAQRVPERWIREQHALHITPLQEEPA